MPDSRRVVYSTRAGDMVVLDVDPSERCVTPAEPALPLGSERFTIAPDGTALCYGREGVESNIWLMDRE